MKDKIYYSEGFKYQLSKTYSTKVNVFPYKEVDIQFIKLDMDGTLTIRSGYAWDGPSGPSWDSPNFMRGSLVHDALYQLMRNSLVDMQYRYNADKALERICVEDGMSGFRAGYVFYTVDKFAEDAASVENVRDIIEAP